MILEATVNPSDRSVAFDVEPLSGRTDVAVTGVRFTCPNDIGIDTNLYDMAIKIRSANARKELFTYYIIEKTIDDDMVSFVWTLNEPASRYDGTLYFNITATESENDVVVKRWNTRIETIEVFKTLQEGTTSVTQTQLTEIETLLNQIDDVVRDYNSAVLNLSETVSDAESAAQAAEQAIAQISSLSASGDGEVTLTGINSLSSSGDGTVMLTATSDPIIVQAWYQEYIEGAKWLKGRSAVASNSDLNNITTIGNYYVSSGTIAASLSHSPITDGAFSLTVERVTADASTNRQVAMASESNSIFIRNSSNSGSTWTAWTEYASRDEILQRAPENTTTFTFDAKRGVDGNGEPAHNHFMLIGGGSAPHHCVWIGFIGATDTTVTISEVTSINYYALTATYNETELTVTSDKTIYGGLRLLWLG